MNKNVFQFNYKLEEHIAKQIFPNYIIAFSCMWVAIYQMISIFYLISCVHDSDKLELDNLQSQMCCYGRTELYQLHFWLGWQPYGFFLKSWSTVLLPSSATSPSPQCSYSSYGAPVQKFSCGTCWSLDTYIKGFSIKIIMIYFVINKTRRLFWRTI